MQEVNRYNIRIYRNNCNFHYNDYFNNNYIYSNSGYCERWINGSYFGIRINKIDMQELNRVGIRVYRNNSDIYKKFNNINHIYLGNRYKCRRINNHRFGITIHKRYAKIK